MKENKSFLSFDNTKEGLLYDNSLDSKYPYKLYNVIGSKVFQEKKERSYHIFVYSGTFLFLKNGYPSQYLVKSSFCSTHGNFSLVDTSLLSECKCIVIEILNEQGVYPDTNYRAFELIGGSLEDEGRLKYIDGCTDSVLINPIKMGDPCLNYLHFPEKIDQTQHTHPTDRVGIVARGNGKCKTPFGDLPLTQGMIFIIKHWDGKTYHKGLDGKKYPIGDHAFQTFEQQMDVIAFHPDSDFGATDVNHPMINRTIVGNVSANKIDFIRTK